MTCLFTENLRSAEVWPWEEGKHVFKNFQKCAYAGFIFILYAVFQHFFKKTINKRTISSVEVISNEARVSKPQVLYDQRRLLIYLLDNFLKSLAGFLMESHHLKIDDAKL